MPANFPIDYENAMKNNQFSLQSTNTSLIKEIGNHTPLWRKEILELPLTNKIIENPATINNNKIIEDIFNVDKVIDDPNANKHGESGKQAARMIVIRRRKMAKHKRKKVAKKMKFVWAKAKQRREWKKERRFLNSLMFKIRGADRFSAEQYVSFTIREWTQEVIPKYWKHRRLPQWLIMELMQEEKQKETDKKYQFWEECGKM